jgi:hypothetical protein
MSDPTAEGPQQQNITITTNLDSEPLHAEQLGHICVNWANLEWQMYHLFEVMSGSPPAVARATFYAIDSTRGRREILLALGTVLFGSTSEQNILDDLLRRIGRTSSQRNKIVHDTWGVASTQGHEIFQTRLSKAGDKHVMEEMTIPDMKATAAHIRKLAEELNAFRARIIPNIPALLEKYRKLPGIALEFGPKGHPPGRKSKGHHGRR